MSSRPDPSHYGQRFLTHSLYLVARLRVFAQPPLANVRLISERDSEFGQPLEATSWLLCGWE